MVPPHFSTSAQACATDADPACIRMRWRPSRAREIALGTVVASPSTPLPRGPSQKRGTGGPIPGGLAALSSRHPTSRRHRSSCLPCGCSAHQRGHRLPLRPAAVRIHGIASPPSRLWPSRRTIAPQQEPARLRSGAQVILNDAPLLRITDHLKATGASCKACHPLLACVAAGSRSTPYWQWIQTAKPLAITGLSPLIVLQAPPLHGLSCLYCQLPHNRLPPSPLPGGLMVVSITPFL
jgi:hypothetical protein